MNVAVMRMDPEEARVKLKAYRRRLHRKVDDEYLAAAKGYAAQAKGLALIDVGRVFRDVQLGEDKRPRLAIARADRKQIEFTWSNDGRLRFSSAAGGWGWESHRWPQLNLEFGSGREPPIHEDGLTRQRRTGFSLVPIVPADALETAGLPALNKCFILWEVEEWADRRIGSQPDRDPYLLRHLHGDLYVVLAEWDLTDLERAVMARRADTP